MFTVNSSVSTIRIPRNRGIKKIRLNNSKNCVTPQLTIAIGLTLFFLSFIVDKLHGEEGGGLLNPCFSFVNPGPFVQGDEVVFDASCTDGGSNIISRYEWRFSDDADFLLSGLRVSRPFFKNGTHTVTLIVSEEIGVLAELTQSFEVSDLVFDFDEHFENGIQSWFSKDGVWTGEGGHLSLKSIESGLENSVLWYGNNPPAIIENNSLQTFHLLDIVFGSSSLLEATGDTIGVLVFANQSNIDENLRGYTFQWNGKEKLFQIVLHSDDGNRVLAEKNVPLGGLPETWSLGIEQDLLNFYIGTDSTLQVTDRTYRQGYLGLTLSKGALVEIDNISLFRGHKDLLILRGDCDGNGTTQGINDAITLLSNNFFKVRNLPCKAACDVNADGDTGGVTDAIMLLTVNFLGGIVIPEPGGSLCGSTGLESDYELGCNHLSPACI